MEAQEVIEARAELFEIAIDATKVGLFNVYLLLLAILATSAIMFASTSVAFLIPSAECFLDISLMQKGYLYAVTYAGMITSALPWAILSDTRGRKPVLVLAHLFDFLFYLMSACSQTVTQLLIFKFFEGFCICGGFATAVTYASELNGRKTRVRFILFTGIMLSVATLIMPICAILIIPPKWELNVIGLTFRSWQLFVLIAGIPSLLTGFFMIFMPESPKFDLARGYHEAAVVTFQKIFTINTGQPKENYPFKNLEAAAPKAKGNTDCKTVFKDGMIQLQPFFTHKYFWLALMVFFVDFCVLMGQNTIRLWLPDLFVSIDVYSKTHSVSGSLCEIQHEFNTERYSPNKTANGTMGSYQICQYDLTMESYINNLIPAAFSIAGYIITIMITRCVSPKEVLSFALLLSSIFGYGLFLATSSLRIILITSLYLAMENICSTSVVILVVSLFPTQMRTTSVSLGMMFGRIGSIIGNIVYPSLIKLGCTPPIIWIGTLGLVVFFVTLFLPNPSAVPFQ